MDLKSFKIPVKAENDRIRTRWQTEVSLWLQEFGVESYMNGFVWKCMGKGGTNFSFLEGKVNTLKQSLKEKGQSLDKSGALFIHVLKQK